MERIKLGDINFEKVKRIKSNYNLESNIYHNDTTAYKIFKGLSREELEIKQRKIELLGDGAELPKVVMPQNEIFSDNYFWGYTMKYINGAIPLFDIKNRSQNINLYFKIITEISKSLETIHKDPRNVVVGDLNFDNIIIDPNFNSHFIDFDSCQIDGIPNETISRALMSYFQFKGIIPKTIDKNSDKLSLLLCTLSILFNGKTTDISMKQYDKRAEQISVLKNMRSTVLEMKKSKNIPTVPYLHEMIPSTQTQPKVRKRI